MKAKSYLLHIYKNDTYIRAIPFYSRTDLESFLKENQAPFAHDKLTEIDDDLISVAGMNGQSFEIEELLPCEEKDCFLFKDGITYVPIQRFCKNHKVTRRKAKYALDTGKIDGFILTRDHTIFIDNAASIS
jgi:hypothetical protein